MPAHHIQPEAISMVDVVNARWGADVVNDVSYRNHLRALTTEATSKLDVLALDGDTLGVDGA